MSTSRAKEIAENEKIKRLQVLETAEKMARNHWYFNDLVEHINVGIVVFDLLKERIVAMNKTAEGYFRNTVKPKDFYTLYNIFFRNNQDSQLNINWYIPRAQVLTYGSRTFGYTIHPMQGGYMGLFVQDITQKERQKALEDAREFVEVVDSVFEGVRDAIDSPTESLKTTLQSLRDQLLKDEDSAKLAQMDRALAKVEQLESLLQSMKDVQSFEPVKIECVDLVLFVKRFAKLLKPYLDRREVKLQTVFPDDEVLCAIDPEMFKRALLNVLANAIDAIENNAAPQITITVFQNNDRIHLTVEDNGIGVPSLLQDKLFYPFYTSKLEATGLGLTTTRKIITLHNGDISVKSIRGVGTVLEIILPVENPPKNAIK